MVRKANQQDLPALAGLGARLWPGHTPQQLAAEFAGTMSGADACFFIKLEGKDAGWLCRSQSDHLLRQGTVTAGRADNESANAPAVPGRLRCWSVYCDPTLWYDKTNNI